MVHKLSFAAGLLSVALLSHTASAGPAPDWYISADTGNWNGYQDCLGVQTNVGYYGARTPRVGHYQDATVLVMVTAGCGSSIAVPDFRLPPQVVQDTTHAVECTVVGADGQRHPIVNDPTRCSTTPINKGITGFDHIYGTVTLQPGERLEVYLPVTWVTPVAGAVFHAPVVNTFSLVEPAVQFDIAAGVSFDSFATSGTGNATTASFVTRHHPDDTGDVVIEYGPTTNYEFVTTVQHTTSSTSQTMTFALPQVPVGTNIHWRVRYIVPFYGAYWSADQLIVPPPVTLPNPNPPPVHPCRFIRCS